jgi:hypothetical protein
MIIQKPYREPDLAEAIQRAIGAEMQTRSAAASDAPAYDAALSVRALLGSTDL